MSAEKYALHEESSHVEKAPPDEYSPGAPTEWCIPRDPRVDLTGPAPSGLAPVVVLTVGQAPLRDGDIAYARTHACRRAHAAFPCTRLVLRIVRDVWFAAERSGRGRACVGKCREPHQSASETRAEVQLIWL